MYDEDFETAASKWKEDFSKWKPSEHDGEEYWEYEGNPPDRERYRPKWSKEEATWIQIYETVSEGTPVTPPFATHEELVEYLVKNGDFWDQQRGKGGWDRAGAVSFVKRGWAPSLIVNRTATETTIKQPRDGI